MNASREEALSVIAQGRLAWRLVSANGSSDRKGGCGLSGCSRRGVLDSSSAKPASYKTSAPPITDTGQAAEAKKSQFGRSGTC